VPADFVPASYYVSDFEAKYGDLLRKVEGDSDAGTGSGSYVSEGAFLRTVKTDTTPRAFYPVFPSSNEASGQLETYGSGSLANDVRWNQKITLIPWTRSPGRQRLYFLPGSVKNRTLTAYVRDS
jgi:hypothetical protein